MLKCKSCGRSDIWIADGYDLCYECLEKYEMNIAAKRFENGGIEPMKPNRRMIRLPEDQKQKKFAEKLNELRSRKSKRIEERIESIDAKYRYRNTAILRDTARDTQENVIVKIVNKVPIGYVNTKFSPHVRYEIMKESRKALLFEYIININSVDPILDPIPECLQRCQIWLPKSQLVLFKGEYWVPTWILKNAGLLPK